MLDEYAKFLRDREFVAMKHQPYLGERAGEFRLFARQHAGCSFEQTLDLLLGAQSRVSGSPRRNAVSEKPVDCIGGIPRSQPGGV